MWNDCNKKKHFSKNLRKGTACLPEGKEPTGVS